MGMKRKPRVLVMHQFPFTGLKPEYEGHQILLLVNAAVGRFFISALGSDDRVVAGSIHRYNIEFQSPVVCRKQLSMDIKIFGTRASYRSVRQYLVLTAHGL